MDVIIAIVFGGAIGFALGVIIIGHLNKPDGVLRIDHSNPKKDTYRFEIDEIEQLSQKKYIRLKVDNEADLSQN